jgi:hypothetical protein
MTRLARLPDVLHYYRRHTDSISRRRRSQMLFAGACAFELAIFRRSPTPPAEQRAVAAQSYLDAALAKASAGELPAAEASIRKVLGLDPALLVDRPDNLDALLTAYTTAAASEGAASFVAELFTGLPPSRAMRRLKDKWLSRVHMRAVFSGVAHHDSQRVRANLWPGLRYDPKWLLNRGVLVIAARSLLDRNGRNGSTHD